MNAKYHSMDDQLVEHLIGHGQEGRLAVFTAIYNVSVKVERERFIGAGCYERTGEQRAFANGYKPKRTDTLAGTATISAPKTASHGDTQFYPKALRHRGSACFKLTGNFLI